MNVVLAWLSFYFSLLNIRLMLPKTFVSAWGGSIGIRIGAV